MSNQTVNINTMRRYREVRDVYNKLRKTYRADVIHDFLDRNYFIAHKRLYRVLKIADSKPVTDASLLYQWIMRDDFKL